MYNQSSWVGCLTFGRFGRTCLFVATVAFASGCTPTSVVRIGDGSESPSRNRVRDPMGHTRNPIGAIDTNPEDGGMSGISLALYSRVVVIDFADDMEGATTLEAAQREQLVNAYTERVVEALREKDVFDEVVRGGEPDGSTLVLRGRILRHVRGNEVGRLFVGFGLGSANFEAKATLHDGSSGELLATITVDKNSLPVGAPLAAPAIAFWGPLWGLSAAVGVVGEVDRFEEGSIRRIASELAAAKKRSPES